jgi:hypothetical protein
MSVDYFPTTQRTWLATQIADGDRGLDAARVHVMERSHAALVAYVRGARVSALGEPDDIVHVYFARNLGKPDYLARWLDSGLSLRRWLMNGVSAHIRTLWRERATHARRHEPLAGSARELASDTRGAERDFERAWIRATLGEACRRVQDALQDGRRPDRDAEVWRVFELHVLEGQPYRAILAAAGESPTRDGEERLAVAVRRVLRLVRAELKAILREDGVRESELDAEVDRMTHLMDKGLDA